MNRSWAYPLLAAGLVGWTIGCGGGTEKPLGLEESRRPIPMRCENSGFARATIPLGAASEHLWTVGDGLFRSTDFGKTFSLIHSGTPSAVVRFDETRALAWFLSATQGTAVTGQVEATEDAGRTWRVVATADGVTPLTSAAVRVDATHVLECRGESIVATSDGSTFRNTGHPCTAFGFLTTVPTNNRDNLVASWGPSRMFGNVPLRSVSFDEGATQEPLLPPSDWAWGVESQAAVGPPGHIALSTGAIESVGCGCAAAPRLALTKDGGKTWAEVRGWPYQVNEMFVDDAGALWLSAFAGDGVRNGSERVEEGDARLIRIAQWDTNVEVFEPDAGTRKLASFTGMHASGPAIRVLAESLYKPFRSATVCEIGATVTPSAPKVSESLTLSTTALTVVARRPMRADGRQWLAVSADGRIATKIGSGIELGYPSDALFDAGFYALRPDQQGRDYLLGGPVEWTADGNLRFMLSPFDPRPALLYDLVPGSREVTLAHALEGGFVGEEFSHFGSMLLVGGRQGSASTTLRVNAPSFLGPADSLPLGVATPDGWFVSAGARGSESLGIEGTLMRHKLLRGERPTACNADTLGPDCIRMTPGLARVEATADGWTCAITERREIWCARFGAPGIPAWRAITGLRHPGDLELRLDAAGQPELYLVDDDVFALKLAPGTTVERSAP